MVMVTLFALDQKYPFYANLVQKIKIAWSNWRLVPFIIWICNNNIFCFRPEVQSSGKSIQKFKIVC